MAELVSALTGGVAGIAVGESASTALEPVFEPITQDAWNKAVAKGVTQLLTAGQLAELVAQALMSLADATDEVARDGYGPTEFNKLVQLALKAPGAPDAEKLYLRGLPSGEDGAAAYPGSITLAQLQHAYAKSGIEYQYWQALAAAAENVLLTPAQVALGVIRSTLTSSGLLVVDLDLTDPTTSGSSSAAGAVSPLAVATYTPATLDPVAEAAAAGVDQDRLRAMVGSIGLPPSTGQLASAWFRGLITRGTYNQGIQEGDARPEWADVWLEQARQILTAHDYTEGLLRGWVPDEQTLYGLTAQWGMSEADTDLLFKITGRPIPVHRITQGKALGGVYDGDTSGIPADYLKSLQESNIRPEWYQLAYLAEQYTWPAYFVLKDIVPDPISVAEATDILTYGGWRPDLAAAVAQSFATGAAKPKENTAADLATQYEAGQLTPEEYIEGLTAVGYTADAAASKKTTIDSKPLVSARTAILSKLRTGVVGGAITTAQALEQIDKLPNPPPAAAQLVALWEQEYEIEHLPPPATATATA